MSHLRISIFQFLSLILLLVLSFRQDISTTHKLIVWIFAGLVGNLGGLSNHD